VKKVWAQRVLTVYSVRLAVYVAMKYRATARDALRKVVSFRRRRSLQQKKKVKKKREKSERERKRLNQLLRKR
jgi:hypothetical protein